MSDPGSTRPPALACFDGSEGSRQALQSAGRILGPRPIVILTVWQSLATQLARTAGFAPVTGFEEEGELDAREEEAARHAVTEGATHAREQGFDATARVEHADSAVWRTIVGVADEIDAELILCGTRGRGSVERILVGSTAHAVLHNARRPVLIAPEPHDLG